MAIKYKHLTIFESQQEYNENFIPFNYDEECKKCKKVSDLAMDLNEEYICEQCYKKGGFKDSFSFIDISITEAVDEYEEYKKEHSNKVIYLIQLKISIDNKNYVVKYVGQTINFESRKKQHIKDFNNKSNSKIRLATSYIIKQTNRDEYSTNDIKIVSEEILKSAKNEQYIFSIIHRAKTKAELNCAEMAYMFMLEPQMNSFLSEANCYNFECKICRN